MKRLFYPPPIRLLLMVIMLLVAGNTFLFAEGSIDFRNYPGNRLFYNVEQDQQLKVYAAAGEFINVGSSHVGINGGAIEVYSPNGNLIQRFAGADFTTAIIFDGAQEVNGPTGPAGNGYQPGVVSATESGIWTIRLTYDTPRRTPFTSSLMNSDTTWTRQFDQPDGNLDRRVALAWDVTVTQGGAGNAGGSPVSGRLYSNEYISILDGNGRSTSPTFYILTKAGYLYEVNFSNTDPWGFPIHSNSFGLVKGDFSPTYMSANIGDDVATNNGSGNFRRSADPNSWDPDSTYLYDPQAEDFGVIINNKIFFNIPDPNLPASALVTDKHPDRENRHTTWLLNEVPAVDSDRPFTFLGIVPLNGPCDENLTAEEGVGGHFVFDSQLAGQAELRIDLNNNGSFDDPEDVIITKNVRLGVDSIMWNGRYGNGDIVEADPAFDFAYDLKIRGGEMHLLLADIENNPGGVVFRRMNGPGSVDENFYFDHSGIGGATSGGGTAGTPLATTTPFTYSNDFGDEKMLDQWAFIETNNFGNGTLAINIEKECSPGDNDGDGIPDIVDIDDDNDGVPDLLEFCHPDEGWACLPGGLDPSGDEDNDGVQNYQDANDPAVNNGCTDANNDGVCDQLIGAYDTDGDNVPDHFDLDSDNDGISDLVEAGHNQPDVDGNGIIDGENSVFGANGFYVALESDDSQTATANYVPLDTDGDGIPDHDDLDSDNDGVADVVEAGYASSDADQDGRIDISNGVNPNTGLVNLIDPTVTNQPIPLPVDWDGDGVPDWHDLDSDNDGILDVVEAGYINSDTNQDGRIDDGNGNVPSVNSDGLPPVIDPALTNQPIPLPIDWDNDGVPDWHDLDSDNDGILDVIEGGYQGNDTNLDGRIDDGSGNVPTVNADGLPAVMSNDGVINLPPDTDSDGVRDWHDLDSDNDGINDTVENKNPDGDNDGFIGTGPITVDANGIATADADGAVTVFTPLVNTDGEGAGDFRDLDADGDGINDVIEGGLSDPDGDGIIGTGTPTVNPFGQSTDGTTSNPPDSDNDGTPDFQQIVDDSCETPPTPSITASAIEVCEGEPVTFTATGVTDTDVSYVWTATSATGSTEITTTVPTLTLDPTDVANTGTYTVATLRDTCSSPASNEVTLTVKPRPDAPVLAVDKDIHCEGERLEFIATPVTGTNVMYEWTFTNPEGRVDPLATTPTPNLVIENLVATNTGTYQVRALVDGCPTDFSNDVEVDVASGGLPDATATSSAPADNPACEGDNVTLSTNEIDGATYEWSGPNGVVGTTAEVVLEDVTAAMSGEYTATITINGCPKTVGPVTVQVDPKPATPTIGVDNATVCPGDGFTLTTSEATGNEISYDWLLNGTIVTNTTDPTLVVLAPTVDDAGSYTVVVKDGGCPSDPSDPVDVTVEPPLEGDISMEPAGGVCEGETVTLTAPSAEDATYAWTGPNGFTSTDAAISLENVTADNNGDYAVTVTVNGCPNEFGPTTLEINPKPATPSINSDKESACPGEAVNFTTDAVDGDAITYDWILDGTVVANTMDPTLPIEDFQEANAGDYTVVVKDGSCPSDPSEPVSVALSEGLEGVTASSNSPVCIGDPINLTVTDVENATFEWTGPNGFTSTEQNPTIDAATEADAGDYTVTVTVDGCPATIPPATVEVTPKPEAPAVTISEGPVCEGTPATVTVADPQDGATYTVLDADGNTVASGTGEMVEVPTDGMAGTNTYTVISQIDGGCPSEPSDPVSLEVSPKPEEEAMINTDPMGDDCGGAPAALDAVAATEGIGTWTSSNPDVVFTDANSPTTEVAGLEDGDVITWTLSNETCGDYSAASITISAMMPEVNAVDDPFSITDNETVSGNVTNNDTPSDGTVTVLSGPSNGVGTIDSDGNISYVPTAGFEGTDQIVYELCDANCPDAPCSQATVTITVTRDIIECDNIPDVISPNSDGLNDALIIPCADFFNIRLLIFNRWGDKVFETDRYQNNWNGVYEGEDLPPGPYYYVFEEDGQEPKTGCVSIAR